MDKKYEDAKNVTRSSTFGETNGYIKLINVHNETNSLYRAISEKKNKMACELHYKKSELQNTLSS